MRQTPHTETLNLSSPGRGEGGAISVRRSGRLSTGPGLATCQARTDRKVPGRPPTRNRAVRLWSTFRKGGMIETMSLGCAGPRRIEKA